MVGAAERKYSPKPIPEHENVDHKIFFEKNSGKKFGLLENGNK